MGTQMPSLRPLSKLSASRIAAGTAGLVTTGLPRAASVGANIAASKAISKIASPGKTTAAARKPSTIVSGKPIPSSRDPAAEVSGLGVPHDLTCVADGLEIAGDEFVERRSFWAGDLDDSVSRRGERHLGDDRSNVVRRDGLEQAGRKPNRVSIRT